MITPCKNICTRDDVNNCTSCGRTAYEIARWDSMKDSERYSIMARLTGNHQYAIDAEEARDKERNITRSYNYND